MAKSMAVFITLATFLNDFVVEADSTSEKIQIDQMLYPSGDKQKLATLSKLWHEYEECCLQLANTLTSSGCLPSNMLMVYVGALAEIQCRLCIAPDEYDELAWFYCSPGPNSTFKSMVENERIVKSKEKLLIYHVKSEDAGLYQCRIGDSNDGTTNLEVVDKVEYTVVKPETSRGSYPAKAMVYGNAVVYTSWSRWTECSVCGKIGLKRRYGICYVKLKRNIGTSTFAHANIAEDIITLFESHPNGIPCHSQYLPPKIRDMGMFKHRRNEIMIAMCKVECQDTIFEVYTQRGELIETANNSDGYYALAQPLPPQPPQPVREIVYATYGQRYTLRCPGTTLHDIPVTWRVGTKRVVPRDLDKSSGGRVHLNARDHIVFTEIQYSDAYLYSCWQRNNLAGTVKLRVWEGENCRWNVHTTLLALIFMVGGLLRITQNILRSRQE